MRAAYIFKQIKVWNKLRRPTVGHRKSASAVHLVAGIRFAW